MKGQYKQNAIIKERSLTC